MLLLSLSKCYCCCKIYFFEKGPSLIRKKNTKEFFFNNSSMCAYKRKNNTRTDKRAEGSKLMWMIGCDSNKKKRNEDDVVTEIYAGNERNQREIISVVIAQILLTFKTISNPPAMPLWIIIHFYLSRFLISKNCLKFYFSLSFPLFTLCWIL